MLLVLLVALLPQRQASRIFTTRSRAYVSSAGIVGLSSEGRTSEYTMCGDATFLSRGSFGGVGRRRRSAPRSYAARTFSASSSTEDSGASVQDIPTSMDIFDCGAKGQFVVRRTPVDKFSETQEPRVIHQLELKQRESSNSGGSSEGAGVVSSIFHATNGPVPRGSLSSIILLSGNVDDKSMSSEDIQIVGELVEGSIRWYLDSGGRISRLSIAVPLSSAGVLNKLGEMGFNASPLFTDEFSSLHGAVVPSSHEIVSCESSIFLAYIRQKAIESDAGKKNSRYGAHLSNLLGRLLHDVGSPKESVEHFTNSLQQEPSSASTFRNLGSAYQAVGNAQMAFASFQQAVQLDPSDALVYLKLAFFYEDFAKMDWDDAADHAERCYRYYLENVDPDDTSVLTRLGNLLVREHRATAAVEVYEQVLCLDASLHNVWFNKAHAHIKNGENSKAIESLRQTLVLEPSIAAASHMLKALSKDEAQKVNAADEQYIRDLFNDYGTEYDNHVKKLLYSAPRVVRQELAKIYKGRFNIPEDEVRGVPAGVDDDGGCTVVVPTIKINNTLDILDLGCGTGLAGAWLKDYANSLTGVDLSDGMVQVAKKKMIYQNLHVTSIDDYLGDCADDFDLVVAVDVLSYIGDLESLFKKVGQVLRPNSHFAFTVEAISRAADDDEGSEDEMEEVITAQQLSPDRRSIIDDEVEALTAANKHRGFKLLRSGRFGYAKAYVDRVLRGMGSDVEVVLSRQFSPRLDAGNPVPGYLYVVYRR